MSPSPVPATSNPAWVGDVAEFLHARDRGAVPIALDDVFGTLSAEGGAAMRRAINEGCKRIDANAW